MQWILLVEDDPILARLVADLLLSEGFLVDTAAGQGEALHHLKEKKYDLVLLDISLPDGNGFVLCSAVKKEKNLPVIFLTASGDEMSVVAGLDMGADDYISKPFRSRELISRIRSVLRRYGKGQKQITLGNVLIDLEKGSAYKAGRDLCLSAMEYKLLLTFCMHPGAVLTRNRLLEEIWDIAGDFVNDNTLTVYIKRLREKIEDDPQNPVIIQTVRGLGYRAVN
jgi:two-component system response regulator RegX3